MSDGKEAIENMSPSLHDCFVVEKGAAKIRVSAEGEVQDVKLEGEILLVKSDDTRVGYLYGDHQDEGRHDPFFVYGVRLKGYLGEVGADGFKTNNDIEREVVIAFDPRGATNLIANMIFTFFPGELQEEVFQVVKQMGEKHQSAQMLSGLFEFLEGESDKRKEKPDGSA